MKKLIAFLSVIFAVLLVGCTDLQPLSFNNKWSDGAVGYSESLLYDVSYDDDYAYADYNFSKNSSTNKLSLNINGTYAVNTKILSSNNDQLPDQVKNSSVLEGNSQLIYLSTKLNFIAEYTYDGKTETYTDTLNTTGYFCSTDSSLAPIYSIIDYDYTLVKLTDSVIIEKVSGQDEVFYSSDTYRVLKKTMNFETSSLETYKDTVIAYQSKTVIDSVSLFLAVRNLSFTKDFANYLPTVHPSYGDAQTLQLTYFNDAEIKDLNLKYNGEDKTGVSFATNAIKYHIDSTNQAGATQLIFLQNGEASGISNKNLMIRYVSPISDYANYLRLGCLVYTLSEVNFSK